MMSASNRKNLFLSLDIELGYRIPAYQYHIGFTACELGLEVSMNCSLAQHYPDVLSLC